MNEKNGFGRDGNLKTRLKFSGIIRPVEVITKVTKKFTTKGLEESEYWIVIDENGARFMIFDEELASAIVIEHTVEIYGKVSISKGGTYLVAERLEEFIPERYQPEEKRSPNWQDSGSVFDMERY